VGRDAGFAVSDTISACDITALLIVYIHFTSIKQLLSIAESVLSQTMLVCVSVVAILFRPKSQVLCGAWGEQVSSQVLCCRPRNDTHLYTLRNCHCKISIFGDWMHFPGNSIITGSAVALHCCIFRLVLRLSAHGTPPTTVRIAGWLD